MDGAKPQLNTARQVFAIRRQNQRFARPVQQGHAHMRLKCAQLLAYGGMTYIQRSTGLDDIFVLGKCSEGS
ncbi:MAG: hypothetical protein Tsb0024_07410 [Ruegeria sp.]